MARRGQESIATEFAGLKADYGAAKNNRFRRRRSGYSSMGSGADYHYATEADFLRMLELARDMDRNDVIVSQAVNRAVANILQDGIKLDAQTGDEGLDRELSGRWRAWADDPRMCDLAGELTFRDIERLVLRQTYVDGDIVALPNKTGALELVEAHRLRTPNNTTRNVVHGVLLDAATRKRLQYWFTKEDVSPLRAVSKVGDTRPYDVWDDDGYKNLFHVYDPNRVSQTRGVTWLAPIFDALGMFEDINFAKLVQQQAVSCFAIIRQRAPAAAGNFTGSPRAVMGDKTTDTTSDGRTRTIQGIAPGMELAAGPGEEIKGFSPNVPNPEFFDHIKLILQLIGVNLGLPLALLLLDASQTNFSGWRGAVDQARLEFVRVQNWLVNRLHREVYLWQVRRWASEDRALAARLADDDVNLFAHRWNKPGWRYIEPLKDAQADTHRLENTLTSPRRLQAERGADWDDVVREAIEDRANAIILAKQTAATVNEQFEDDPITWRELLPLPGAGKAPVAMAPAAPEQVAEDDMDDEQDGQENDNGRQQDSAEAQYTAAEDRAEQEAGSEPQGLQGQEIAVVGG